MERIWRNLLDAPRGPMSFRFILQPLMSAIVAIHDSVKDARSGRLRHFWTVADDPRERMRRVDCDGQNHLLGIAMDVIYQFIQRRSIRLALLFFFIIELIALLLAFIPYLLIRGPATLIVRWWRGGASGKTR